MSLAASLKQRVNAVLNQYAPTYMTAYKRVVTRSGGDDLTGHTGTVTNTDTLLNPQPVYGRALRRQVGGTDAEIMATSTESKVGQLYEMIVSADAMSITDIESQNVLVVLKDPTTQEEEVYRIADYEPMGVSGGAVAYLLYIRSATR